MLSGFPIRLAAMKTIIESASVGTIAVVPNMLVFVMVKKKYAAVPIRMEETTPVEYSLKAAKGEEVYPDEQRRRLQRGNKD